MQHKSLLQRDTTEFNSNQMYYKCFIFRKWVKDHVRTPEITKFEDAVFVLILGQHHYNLNAFLARTGKL